MWSPEGSGTLAGFAERTRGHDYAVNDLAGVADAAQKIGVELRSQYVLGYIPSNGAQDGKYHRLRVEIVPLPRRGAFSAYWRRGYYAPRY